MTDQIDSKRHIGNDLVVIVFWEGAGAFDASQLVTQMSHVFLVVQRVPSLSASVSAVPRYHVGVICKGGVAPFEPFLPVGGLFDGDTAFRDWLCMKIINGERAVFQTPMFRKKLLDTRRNHLDRLVAETASLLGSLERLSPPIDLSSLPTTGLELQCKALITFKAPVPTQLSFKKGDKITVYHQYSIEWWNGATANQRGDFPAAKVAVIKSSEGAEAEAVARKVTTRVKSGFFDGVGRSE